MSEPLSLLQLQQRFSEVISNQATSFPSSYLALRETDSVSLKTRLGIYQYSYWARIEESLEEDFVKVAKALGSKHFRGLVRRYIEKYPSRFASLAEVSAGIPGLLMEEGEVVLSEVARFEWLLILSFLTDDPEPSNLAEMAQVAPEEMDQLRFKLAPSLYFFESEYPVQKKKVEDKQETRLIIYRKRGEAVHCLLTRKQWVLLKALDAGKSLSELAELQDSYHLTEKQVGEWFQNWGAVGIIWRFYR